MRRYLENGFRFKALFLIPALAIPIIALLAVAYAGRQYEVGASIWVEASPFSDPLVLSRAAPNEIEAQALRERLKTESFPMEVMDRTGLTSAIQQGQWPIPSKLQSEFADAGFGDVPGIRGALKAIGLLPAASTPDEALAAGRGMVKNSISVSATGTSKSGDPADAGNHLLGITYKGKEPFIGKRIIEEIIAVYNEKTLEIQRGQLEAATAFYAEQGDRVNRAAEELQRFLETHPVPAQGRARSAEEEADLERLRRNLALEQALDQAALSKLDQLRVQKEAVISGRNLNFQVVDPPTEPQTSGFQARSMLMALIFGLTLGIGLGLASIVLLTWLDNTVRTREDIEQMVGSNAFIAQVPIISLGGKQRQDLVRIAMAQQAMQQP